MATQEVESIQTNTPLFRLGEMTRYELDYPTQKRWLRIFEQNFRADKWNLCQGYAASRSGSLKYA